MVGPIVQRRPHVDNWEACDDTVAHGLLQSLCHTRDVFLGHDTSLDLRDKLEATSRLQRLKLDSDICKLSRTSRLLLVHISGFDCLGDGFTVVHL